jgi:hypothetical protein
VLQQQVLQAVAQVLPHLTVGLVRVHHIHGAVQDEHQPGCSTPVHSKGLQQQGNTYSAGVGAAQPQTGRQRPGRAKRQAGVQATASRVAGEAPAMATTTLTCAGMQ